MRTSQTQTILSRLAGSILDNRRPACRCELLTCLMMMTTVCDVLKCDPTSQSVIFIVVGWSRRCRTTHWRCHTGLPTSKYILCLTNTVTCFTPHYFTLNRLGKSQLLFYIFMNEIMINIVVSFCTL